MTAPRRVVLLGKGDLAIRVGEWFAAAEDYRLDLVVPVRPEPVWTGSLTGWARERGIALLDSGDHRDLLGGERWELAFSVFYDKIVGADFIALCDRILNLHNGPLPRYRGMAPINWALKNGEELHGVTIHEVTPGIDDGPIIGQVKYSIYPEVDEVQDVYARALAFGWTLFEQTMPLLDRVDPRIQDEDLATYYTATALGELGERRSFTRAESVQGSVQ